VIQRLPVVYRLAAIEDLEAIYLLILEVSGSSQTARGFVGRIMARCRRIGNVPSGGRPRDDLAPGLRLVPFERAAVIAYVTQRDRVEITNVFYGGRDYETLFRAKPGGN
jgi:toxin ParE1/3/4